MTTVRHERTDYLSYAVYNVAAKSNEDRFSSDMNHANCGMESMASFGVFDGHMGVSIL